MPEPDPDFGPAIIQGNIIICPPLKTPRLSNARRRGGGFRVAGHNATVVPGFRPSIPPFLWRIHRSKATPMGCGCIPSARHFSTWLHAHIHAERPEAHMHGFADQTPWRARSSPAGHGQGIPEKYGLNRVGKTRENPLPRDARKIPCPGPSHPWRRVGERDREWVSVLEATGPGSCVLSVRNGFSFWPSYIPHLHNAVLAA